MLNNLTDRIRECYEHAEGCSRKAAVQTDPVLKQDFLDLERRWLVGADLLVIRESVIKESGQLLASVNRDLATLNNVDRVLVSSSRALIAESKHLLAKLDEGRTPPQRNRANLSIGIFEEVSGYGWTVRNHANEMLACGTAGTEHEARIDAFHAGMIYIDRLKGRSAPKDSSSLH